MTILYFILFLIAALYLVVLLKKFGNNIPMYYYLLCFCMILVNFGYWQSSISDIVEEALSANRITYLGSCFISLFMLCCIAQLTKTRIPPVILGIGVGLAVVLAALGMTVGHSDIYYKSAQLAKIGDFAYLVKEYAPLHGLYILNVVLSMGYGLYMIGVAFTKRNEVSYISSVCSLAAMVGVSLVYLVKIGPYSLLPLAYDVGFAILLALMNRVYLYNTEGLSIEEIKDSQEYGFVTFDSKRRFLGGDAVARKWFPELNDLKVDYAVSVCNTDFLRQVNDWVTGQSDAESTLFVCGDRIIKAKCSALTLRTRNKAFCIRLQDDTKQQEYTRLIEHYNQDLQENIALKTERIQRIQNDITISMASIVENRDANTGGHIRRTSDIVRVFVEALIADNQLPELDQGFADRVIRSAPLHDFGKIAIPDVILNKPGKFTPEEYEIMKKHPIHGAVIVERILQNSEDTAFKIIAKNVASYHHEKWDGTGYPEGLKDEEIPLEARIMALADVFDALVSKRAYKEKYSFEQAFSIIRESGGNHFDPFLCQQFLKCSDKLMEVYAECIDA